MTSKTALFALLALWGVAVGPTAPCLAQALAAEAADADSDLDETRRLLVDRVWQLSGSELPGVILVFLSDGTLIQDSCWETHRLSPWTMTSGLALGWSEDGMDIAAEIVSIGESELVLRLLLSGGPQEQRYAPAEVPSVCPDMPR